MAVELVLAVDFRVDLVAVVVDGEHTARASPGVEHCRQRRPTQSADRLSGAGEPHCARDRLSRHELRKKGLTSRPIEDLHAPEPDCQHEHQDQIDRSCPGQYGQAGGLRGAQQGCDEEDAPQGHPIQDGARPRPEQHERQSLGRHDSAQRQTAVR